MARKFTASEAFDLLEALDRGDLFASKMPLTGDEPGAASASETSGQFVLRAGGDGRTTTRFVVHIERIED